jgi:hypothetical protein
VWQIDVQSGDLDIAVEAFLKVLNGLVADIRLEASSQYSPRDNHGDSCDDNTCSNADKPIPFSMSSHGCPVKTEAGGLPKRPTRVYERTRLLKTRKSDTKGRKMNKVFCAPCAFCVPS